MSWDAELVDDRGHIEGEWNYTYNTTPMVCAAAASAGVPFDGFQHSLHGMTGPEGGAVLTAVIREMTANPARYEAMNPENGWGSYDGILRVMRSMVSAIPEWPTEWKVT
jgi:hypothetical protein